MSSILKALQRVEQERPAGAAPSTPRRGLQGDFAAQQGKPLLRRPRRRRPNLWIWGSLAALLLLATLVWWRLPGADPVVAAAPEAGRGEGEGEPAPPDAPRVARAEPAAAPLPSEAAVVTPPAAELAAAPAAEAPPLVARSDEPQPAPAPESEAQAAPAVDVPVALAERLPPLGSTLEGSAPAPAAVPPAAEPPAPVQEAPIQAEAGLSVQEAPVPKAEAPATAARPAPEPAPAARPAPEPARAPPAQPLARATPARPAVAAKPAPPPAPSAPAVLVERTRWHPSAERRAAWVSVEGIDGTRELHEGEAVGALVVKEIRPSAVLFLHGADTLQRKVGQRE